MGQGGSIAVIAGESVVVDRFIIVRMYLINASSMIFYFTLYLMWTFIGRPCPSANGFSMVSGGIIGAFEMLH